MRRLVIAIALAAAFGALAACGGGNGEGSPSSGPVALPTRTVEAGEVTVKIEPLRVDANGAEFKLTFDTHSVPLDLDVARSASLAVADTAWDGANWSGDGPGGHHREGTVRFAARGPATGTVALRLVGLPGPVDATWVLGG